MRRRKSEQTLFVGGDGHTHPHHLTVTNFHPITKSHITIHTHSHTHHTANIICTVHVPCTIKQSIQLYIYIKTEKTLKK